MTGLLTLRNEVKAMFIEWKVNTYLTLMDKRFLDFYLIRDIVSDFQGFGSELVSFSVTKFPWECKDSSNYNQDEWELYANMNPFQQNLCP